MPARVLAAAAAAASASGEPAGAGSGGSLTKPAASAVNQRRTRSADPAKAASPRVP
jgi:hypothetical protein